MKPGELTSIALVALALLLALLLAWYVLRLAHRRALVRAAGGAPMADAGPIAAAAGLVAAVRAAFAGVEEQASAAYQVPLVLLAGTPGAARSTLAAGEGAEAFTAPLSWHSTPHGWVLYADMAAFGFDTEEGGDGWLTLAQELERRRPRRPLDGILLAVPAYGLSGPDAWPPLERERRAAQGRRRLGELQRRFGLRLPVYLLITDCQRMDGFASFAASLPESMRSAMLGWSNPHDSEAPYDPLWLNDAFAQLARTVADLQAGLSAADASIGDSDAFFLLPGAIARLAMPAGLYANQLLGDDAHSVSPMFRGLYLCGDPATVTEAAPGRPWFAGDLLARKVFPERGLARPLSGQIPLRNKLVRRWAAACAAVLLLWGGALAWDHVQLRKQAARYAETLQSINTEQELRIQKRHQYGHMTYQSYQLASQHIMDAILQSDSALSYVSMPASWRWTGQQKLVSNLSEQFGKGLANIVYRTLEKGMNQQLAAQTGAVMDNITHELNDNALCSVGPNSNLEPLAPAVLLADTGAFKRLERFVDDAGEFEKARKNLDDLYVKKQGGYGELVKVSAFTQAFDLPNAEQRHNPVLQSALSGHYVPEDARLHRQRQRDSLLCAFHAEHNQFLVSLVEHHPARLAAETIHDQLHGALTTSKLEGSKLIFSLKQLSAWLKAPTVLWLDQAESGAGKAYGALLRKVQDNSLLGPKETELARQQWAQRAEALRQGLIYPNHSANPMLQQLGDGSLALTPELANLQAGLERLTRQGFMAEVKAPETLVRQGLGPLWDVKRLNLALAQASEARAFLNKEVPTFPLPLQRELRRLGEQRLADNLLITAGAGLPAGANEADTYQRLGQAEKQLTPLLEVMSSLDAEGPQHTLAHAVAAQANDGLRWLESELRSNGFYQPRDGNFDWWQGTPNPAAQAFAGGDPQALEDYLAAQQARVEAALRQAQPLMRLVQAAQGSLSSIPARHWSEIANEVARYQEKQPNTHIAQLNAFIRAELSSADARKCPLAASMAGGNDLFSERRRALAAALASRCNVLARTRLDQSYLALREQFRRTLAGRFPFAADGRNGEPAALDDVLAYLQLYDQLAPDIQRMAPGRERDFVQASGAVRAFLGPLLPPAEGADSAGYVLAVRFRVGANGEADGNNALAGESGGNRIASWRLQSGEDTVSWDGAARGAVQQLPWKPGLPMVLTLRWADNVSAVPLDNGSDRYLEVEGRKAVYRFSEPWSLLRLLKRYSAPAAGPGAQPAVLRFDIPSSDGAPATRVFMRIAVMPAQKKEVLAVPVFPAAVPGDEPLRLSERR